MFGGFRMSCLGGEGNDTEHGRPRPDERCFNANNPSSA